MSTQTADLVPTRETGRQRLLPALTALLVLIASGYVYGQWTGRWARSSALTAAVERLATVPRAFGEWEGRDGTIDPDAVDLAGIAGYISRQYRDRRTGRTLNALVVCGRPGPIAVHSPEICYGGSGYETVGPRMRVTVADAAPAADTLWAVELEKPGAVADRLRVLYAWSADGEWHAADRPRYGFAGAGVLYKLYIVARPDGDKAATDEFEAGFLREFLPLLRGTAFAQQPSGKG